MIRKSQILSAVALAVMLPIAAYAAGTTTAAKSTTAAKTKTHMASTKAPKMPAVDINSASKEDLMKISGVTDEIAEKIIAGRPYKSKAELSTKSIVTKAEYKKIRGHVIAKQETKVGSAPEGSKTEETKTEAATGK